MKILVKKIKKEMHGCKCINNSIYYIKLYFNLVKFVTIICYNKEKQIFQKLKFYAKNKIIT